MSNVHIEPHPGVTLGAAPPETRHARQAYEILHWAFVIAPAIAGLDKFVDVLTRWDKYLAPAIADRLPVTPHTFMIGVGVVEIIASLVVAVRPRIGAYLVAGWLAAIIVNLVAVGGYFDVALRDLGLCLAALALARLSADFDRDTAGHRARSSS